MKRYVAEQIVVEAPGSVLELTPSAFNELLKDLGPEAVFERHTDGRTAILLRYGYGEQHATFVMARVQRCPTCQRPF